MARTDDDLERQIRRIERRLRRVRREHSDKTERIARLERRRERLGEILAMPIEQRPPAVGLSPQLVRSALDAALLVASLTPAGGALKGLQLGASALKKVERAIAGQDLEGTLDGLLQAVRGELGARGRPLDEDDEALASLLDGLEQHLDRETS